MTRKLKLLLPLLLFAWVLLSVTGSGSAEAAYLITAEELQQLDSNLTQLESINNQLRTDLLKSKQDLLTVRTELVEVQRQLLQSSAELKSAKDSLTKASESLQTANESFNKYSKEVSSEIRALKLQRTILGAAIAYLIIKK